MGKDSAVKEWVHFIAIGGTGMGAVAALMQDKGYLVTGSDGPLYPPMSTFLTSRKIARAESYRPENLLAKTWGFKDREHPDLIVIGNAISRGHLEAAAAEELAAQGKCLRLSFPEALAKYCIEGRKSFVVAGTHGKTTTTSVMAWALESLGQKPGFLIGGIPKNFSQGCRAAGGDIFVSEGDEYDTAYWDKEAKFLHYKASWVLCTGIEFDHADIYASLADIEKSFLKLCGKTREGWLLIDQASAPEPSSVEKISVELKRLGKKLFRYGVDPKSDFVLLSEVGPVLRLNNGEEWKLCSPLIGKHNALNLLGVIATLFVSGELKTQAEAQKFLNSFEGIKRRQEEVFSSSQRIIIDDFAHHPTAIRETLQAVRHRYKGSKIAAFFEPRSATVSRNILAHEMAACFDEADAIFLSPPTKTNIPEGQKLKMDDLKKEITERAANKNKLLVIDSSVELLAQKFQLWASAEKAPVVALVMSNGPFGGIHVKLQPGYSG